MALLTVTGSSHATRPGASGHRYGHAERFMAPVAITSADSIADGQAFGPACPQAGNRYTPISEDCLFLNVWTRELDQLYG